MSKKQMGLRLEENDTADIKRIASAEGRSEQDIVRDSIRMYIRMYDERQKFLSSVEQGWYELHSGLGEVVTDDDNFFDSVRREILNEKTPS